MVDILRGKRLNPMDDKALKITSSVDADRRIMKKIVYVNAAHVKALKRAGLIEPGIASELLSALDKELDGYNLDYRYEDAHMSLEEDLKSKVGEMAGFIGLGKSRNDQVATSIRLEAREELLSLTKSVAGLLASMLEVSKSQGALFIGMTHLQPAQPITVSHWILNYAESILRTVERLKLAYRTTNISPMGAAALAGSTVPLDRLYTSHALAFDAPVENTIDAVSSRDFAIDTIYAISMLASDLSRMSSDIIVYMSLGYMDLDDRFVSTSSLMPQKRNAVVAEILRAKSANLVSMLFNSIEINRTLNTSYNLDLQEITPRLWSAFDEIVPMVEEMSSMIKGIRLNEELINRTAKDSLITASDAAEYISMKYSMPFRDAHHIVGEAIRKTENNRLPLAQNISGVLAGKVNASINQQDIEDSLDPQRSIFNRVTLGGPHPDQSGKMISNINLQLDKLNAWVASEEKKIEKAYELLFSKEW
ncbi:MAG: argininosuccinate lyase [Nitrososphaerota archaeon]|jgi:argininosuccinate lyase|nr:argininosuccinate lyase [Nitrososphaerota archaeon]MDG6926969.1 argininosuccinate lyase [Nitrososphaerota archaeon]MDG6930470.1 argininosuccinate lyase [Nitrososphaerota archaeon]MDG6931511.1 argininosuccinate lyase [Nitrososphaerota archaeon]MDG6936384.1 argininosuccinate lyase [Nitrososphaerota archaeon]